MCVKMKKKKTYRLHLWAWKWRTCPRCYTRCGQTPGRCNRPDPWVGDFSASTPWSHPGWKQTQPNYVTVWLRADQLLSSFWKEKKSIWLILKKMVLNVMKYEELERLRLFLLWKPAAVSNIYICKFNVNSKCILHTITKEMNLISPLAPSEARILCLSTDASFFPSRQICLFSSCKRTKPNDITEKFLDQDFGVWHHWWSAWVGDWQTVSVSAQEAAPQAG